MTEENACRQIKSLRCMHKDVIHSGCAALELPILRHKLILNDHQRIVSCLADAVWVEFVPYFVLRIALGL